MAKTRLQIRTSVNYNTQRGTEKESLINDKCDEALKVAIGKHPFRDSRSTPSALSVTEDAVTVDISSISNLVHIVSARMIEDSGSSYHPLIMKDATWWDRNIVNPEDNQKGWPKYGLRAGSYIYLDRPAQSDLTLQLRVSTEQLFTDDSTECPVKILDIFVVQYVTAQVFLSIENMESYYQWKRLSLGPKWDDGVVGGSLAHAINTDKIDLSEEFKAERYDGNANDNGVSIQNLVEGHSRYGEIDTWY